MARHATLVWRLDHERLYSNRLWIFCDCHGPLVTAADLRPLQYWRTWILRSV